MRLIKWSGLVMLMAVTSAMAGETHYGSSGWSKESACQNAEARARQAAKTKGTCYEQCDVRQCVKDKDGQFVCSATSANEQGSCGASDKIKP